MDADERRVIEVVGRMVTVLAVCGVLLNNAKMPQCFWFWMLSNALSSWVHYRHGIRSLLVRDLIFFALACVGLWQWTM